MAIEVHEAASQDDLPRKWVLAGDNLIGEVTCTKKQALVLAAGPDLLASCKLLICYLSDQADSGDNPGLTNACAGAVRAINKAEGRSV